MPPSCTICIIVSMSFLVGNWTQMASELVSPIGKLWDIMIRFWVVRVINLWWRAEWLLLWSSFFMKIKWKINSCILYAFLHCKNSLYLNLSLDSTVNSTWYILFKIKYHQDIDFWYYNYNTICPIRLNLVFFHYSYSVKTKLYFVIQGCFTFIKAFNSIVGPQSLLNI